MMALLGLQPHDRQARDALPAAGLADDPECLPALDGEVDAFHRLDEAVVGAEARAQVANLEKRHQLSRILGSMTAYITSTNRLKTMMHRVANTTVPMITGRSKLS